MILKALGKKLYAKMEVKDALKRGDILAYDKIQGAVMFLRFDIKVNSWERLTIANMRLLYFPLNDPDGRPASDFRKHLRFRELARLIADLSGFNSIAYVDSRTLPEDRYLYAYRIE